MKLNLKIDNFAKNGKIIRKYICKNHDGNNISPEISWECCSKNDTKIKSYALILEDPDAVNGNFVHWYIPFIDKNIDSIESLYYNNCVISNSKIKDFKILNKLSLIMGKNSLSEIGYHGPCAPEDSGTHRYFFNLYALNGKLNINNNNIQISGSSEFYNILENAGIKIINKDQIVFEYEYKKYC